MVQVELWTVASQVKSYHFHKKIETKKKYFYFLYIFLGLMAGNDIEQPFWILIRTHYYLLNGIGLDWHLNNSFWIQNIPNVPTNNINIWFLTHNSLSDQSKLDVTHKIIQESLLTFLKLSHYLFKGEMSKGNYISFAGYSVKQYDTVEYLGCQLCLN